MDISRKTWRYADTFDYMERVGVMPPMMVCVACNGGVQGKEYNPALPETADEIASSVKAVFTWSSGLNLNC